MLDLSQQSSFAIAKWNEIRASMMPPLPAGSMDSEAAGPLITIARKLLKVPGVVGAQGGAILLQASYVDRLRRVMPREGTETDQVELRARRWLGEPCKVVVSSEITDGLGALHGVGSRSQLIFPG